MGLKTRLPTFCSLNTYQNPHKIKVYPDNSISITFILHFQFLYSTVKMSKKSWWESPFWQAIGALAALATVVGFLLQILGGVDVYELLVVPIINFFLFPVPLFSIPLAFLILIAVLYILAYASDSKTIINDYLARADSLDDDCARYMALFCQNPRTTESLKQKYRELVRRYGGYSFEHYLKELEERGLLEFQDNKWIVTQKALDYIRKYHG